MQSTLLKPLDICKSVPETGNMQRHRNLGATCRRQTCIPPPNLLLVADHLLSEILLLFLQVVDQPFPRLPRKPDPNRPSSFQPLAEHHDVHQLLFNCCWGQALPLQRPDGTKRFAKQVAVTLACAGMLCILTLLLPTSF